jgi:hypothetical protein
MKLTQLLGQAEGLVQYSDSEYRLQRTYVRVSLHSEPHSRRGEYLPVLLIMQVGDDKPIKYRLSTQNEAYGLVTSKCGVGMASNLFRQRDTAYRAA